MEIKKPKTEKQFNALHVLCGDIAEKLNKAGLDMKKILKPEVDIPWSKQSVKDFLWRPLQKVMTGKKSTTDLTTDEVTKTYEVLNKFLGEKHGVHIPFPSNEVSMITKEKYETRSKTHHI